MTYITQLAGHRATLGFQLIAMAFFALAIFLTPGTGLGQSPPTGPAGGALAGTYPNPGLAVDRVRKTGDTVTGAVNITLTNPGTIVVPFILSTTGNPLLNRGLAVQFQVPSGTSGGIGYSMLGGQITNAWGANAQTYMGFSGYNGTAMAEVFRLDGRGVVGIGTTTPSTAFKLDVQGGSVNASGGLCIAGDCKSSWAQVGGGTGSQWTTAGSAIHYNTGNVGIGTTAPTQGKLVVSDATQLAPRITLSGQEFYQAANTSTEGVAFLLGVNRASNRQLWIADSAALTQNSTNPTIRISPNGRSIDAISTNGTALNLILNSNGGKVGIGLASPLYSLDVNGGINGFRAKAATVSSSDAIATFENTSGVQAIIRGNGNIGIGTASPAKKLHLFGSNSQIFVDRTANTAGNYALLNFATNGVQKFFFGMNADAAPNVDKLSLFDSAVSPTNPVMTFTGGNVGVGTMTPTAKLHVAGNGYVTGSLTVDGNIAAKYQDLAEWVESSQTLAAGTVVVLDHTRSNQVIASSQAYDTRVAGVISLQPGIMLGESGAGKVLVATTGRVKIKVDATAGPIQIGDLLVTSDKEGVAKKSEPLSLGGVQIHRPGTLIGKALEPLAQGTGEILVLLSLQ